MTARQWHLTGGGHVDGAAGTATMERPVSGPAGPVTETPARGSGARRLGVIGLAPGADSGHGQYPWLDPNLVVPGAEG